MEPRIDNAPALVVTEYVRLHTILIASALGSCTQLRMLDRILNHAHIYGQFVFKHGPARMGRPFDVSRCFIPTFRAGVAIIYEDHDSLFDTEISSNILALSLVSIENPE